MTREQFEGIVREQIARAATNAAASGVTSSGMASRCTEQIMGAADRYVLHMVDEVLKPIPEDV